MREQSEPEKVRFASLMSLALTFVVFLIWAAFILGYGKIKDTQAGSVSDAPSLSEIADGLNTKVSKTFTDDVNMGDEVKR